MCNFTQRELPNQRSEASRRRKPGCCGQEMNNASCLAAPTPYFRFSQPPVDFFSPRILGQAPSLDAELPPLQSAFTLSRCVGHNHREHLLVYIDPHYLISLHVHPSGTELGACYGSERELSSTVACYRPSALEARGAHLSVRIHAPDQTGLRPRLIHCPNDLVSSGLLPSSQARQVRPGFHV